ncbi:MAG TPA: hypothetical protein PLI95_13030, partial [Polyangiaceae bacterium]|nr:hypothetical protein [Polyangiaceae bacterium]
MNQQVTPALQRLVHPAQLPHRVDRLVVELQDLVEHRDQRAVALDVVAIDCRDLAQHLEATLAIVGADALELLAEQIDERRPCLGLAIQALEGGAGVVVLRVLAQQHLVLLDRLAGVLARLGQLRDLGPDRGLLLAVGQRTLRVGEDRHQAPDVAGLLAELA